MKLSNYTDEIILVLSTIRDKEQCSLTNMANTIRSSTSSSRPKSWWIKLGKVLLSVPGVLEQKVWIIDFKLYQSYIVGGVGNNILEHGTVPEVEISDMLDSVVSSKVSHDMYKQGKTVDEIANYRNIQHDTVVKHLIVEMGQDFDTSKYITKDELDAIANVIREFPQERNSVWKQKLGHLENITYLKIEIAATRCH